MDYDHELDDEYEDDYEDYASSYHNFLQDGSKNDIDPLDIKDPKSAYFYLSDDVQDEFGNTGKRKMRCESCGHKFKGDIIVSCPNCYSLDTEEI